jgi:antitoxin component YwqK of YwqJK toxin-antitoxin module
MSDRTNTCTSKQYQVPQKVKSNFVKQSNEVIIEKKTLSDIETLYKKYDQLNQPDKSDQNNLIDSKKQKDMNNLEILLKTNEQYVNDPKYVYKKCVNIDNSINSKSEILTGNSDRVWLVIMKKTNETIDNESRANVKNKMYAKFRANILYVEKIVSVMDPNCTVDYIVNTFGDSRKAYIVGEIVSEPGYDSDIDIVCSCGIHYFRTLEAAYFYESIPINHIGLTCVFNESGDILEEYDRLSLSGEIGDYTKWSYSQSPMGMITCEKNSNGQYTNYYSNGQKMQEGKCINFVPQNLNFLSLFNRISNTRNSFLTKFLSSHLTKFMSPHLHVFNNTYTKIGQWTTWHWNGEKESEGEYVDGKESGLWIYWNDKGFLLAMGYCVNGRPEGQWILPLEFERSEEGKFVDGNKSGLWITRYMNGKEYERCNYIDGKKDGVVTKLYDSGQKKSEKIYIDGKKYWKWTYWHKNGQKKREGEHLNGERHGKWIEWNNKGMQMCETTYDKGVDITTYDNGVDINENDYIYKNIKSTEFHRNIIGSHSSFNPHRFRWVAPVQHKVIREASLSFN